MKTIKDKIAYFTFENRVDERSNKLLFQMINEMKNTINERKLSGLFVSLKGINCDTKILKLLVEKLNTIAPSISAPVCIGEFTTAQYTVLKEETKNTYVKLFKTFGLAQLFLNTKNFKKQLKVLMFDDGNEEELDKQASMLTKFEHNILYTKDMKEFREKIEDPNVDFSVSQTKINKQIDTKTTKPTKEKFSLSKKLITNLPVFIDTAVDNLETMTGLSAKKTSHTISLFNQDIEKDIVSAIMQFKGDIEGKFVLIFPKEIALISIEAMLGEKVSENDIEGITDGIAEFCNIITGGAKTRFSKDNIKVLFELPRTYTSISATTNAIPHNNGIWINMELEKKHFYMYIVN